MKYIQYEFYFIFSYFLTFFIYFFYYIMLNHECGSAVRKLVLPH